MNGVLGLSRLLHHQTSSVGPSVVCLRSGALKKTIADAHEQGLGRVRIFLRQSSFKVRAEKRRMSRKRFPKQGLPFIRESDPGASAIALDIIPSDDPLGFQAVQHAG